MAGKKNPAAERIGGPGASHENRKHPERSERSRPRGKHPVETQSPKQSGVSGGGGEPDIHHSHDPRGKAGR
jgi:hypothetical protein